VAVVVIRAISTRARIVWIGSRLSPVARVFLGFRARNTSET
jgi:hypothetical protein